MTATNEQLIEDILETQQRIGRAVHRSSSGWLDVELTMAQLKTLVVLVDEGPGAIGEVAEALEVSLPNASHLVERLVRLGLARRAEDPLDRRRTVASASPSGEELLRGLRAGGRDQMRAALRRLDDAELRALAIGMAALARAAADETAARTAQSAELVR